RGRAGEPMDYADDEGPRNLIEAQPPESPVQPGLLRLAFGPPAAPDAGSRTQPSEDADQVEEAEDDQHHRYGEFHRQPEAGRDDQPEQNDGAADRHDGHGVPHAPQAADQGGEPERSLAAHDRRDCEDVV